MLHRREVSPRARFFLACAVGGAAALVLFAYFLLEGRADLFRREFFSDFYDVQARALMDGHWDVGEKALAFERFTVGGKYFTYFGPWPSILRMPILALTHDLDGELSRASMLIAFSVAVGAVSRLCWQARTLLHGVAQISNRTLVAAAGFVFVVGSGSTLLFLGGRSWVYHEAILWGLAWSLTAYACIIAYVVEPTRTRLVLCSLTSTLAFLSRATVGAGPVLVLGALLATRLALGANDRWRRTRESGGTSALGRLIATLHLGDPSRRPRIWPLAIAAAVPVASYAYVNFAKFGSLFGLPLDKQDVIVASPTAQAAFDANGGSITGLVYAPTNLLQYFRPDAIQFDRLFPWVTFSKPPRVLNGAVFIDIDFSASITATSTFLLGLAVIGVVAVFRPGRSGNGRPNLATLRVPIVIALIPGLVTVSIAYTQQRYQADFLPLLVLAGAAGLWCVPIVLTRLVRRRVVRGGIVVAMVVLGAWSSWAMASLTWQHQRVYGPLVPQASTARLLDVQLAVHGVVPGGAPSGVVTEPELPLPPPAEAQSLLVIGECDGLYYSVGRAWIPVEETAATGTFRLRVEFEDLPAGTREPMLSSSDARGTGVLWAVHLDRGRIRFVYEWDGEPVRPPSRTGALRVRPGQPIDLDIRLDPAIGYFEVRHEDRSLGLDYTIVAGARATIGAQTGASNDPKRFSGQIRSLTIATPVCDRLTRLD